MTYLVPNKVQLFIANVDGFRDRAKPNIVIFGVLKGHDGFHAGPSIIVWVYAESAVCEGSGNVGVHEA
jgi:hypothetical protein